MIGLIRHGIGGLIRRMVATSVTIRSPVHAFLLVLLVPLCFNGRPFRHDEYRNPVVSENLSSAVVLAHVSISKQPMAPPLADIDGDAPQQGWHLPQVAGARVELCQWRTRHHGSVPWGTGSARGPPPMIGQS